MKRLKIWLFNNYNTLPEHGHFNRNYYLGKYLKRLGHEPVVFAGSHPHNTNIQLITGKERYKIYQRNPFPWVLIKTCNYEGSKLKRIWSMFQYDLNSIAAMKLFEKPDVIIGSSGHPLAALLAIKMGRKYGCMSIVEIRDLWPESMVAYGVLKRSCLITKILYRLEKYLYMNCDKLIFTMEGAYDYIIDRGWEKDIPKNKVYFVNNGIDLEMFNFNKKNFEIDDKDLLDPNTYKIIYTGTIRKANNLGILLDVAKKINNKKIKFLIWGTGNELSILKERVKKERIDNVIFKGWVEKKYIPYIISQADVNLAHGEATVIGKYGLSLNKMFDYAAAGKPILFDYKSCYNPILLYGAGEEVDGQSITGIACMIDKMSGLDEMAIRKYCKNAARVVEDYDYSNLAVKLVKIIQD